MDDLGKLIPEWAQGFISGILSSIVASYLIIIFNIGKSLIALQKIIIHAAGVRQIRKMKVGPKSSPDDKRNFIRNEWAISLRDLAASDIKLVRKALETLSQLADILVEDEVEAAREILRKRFAINNHTTLNTTYLKTMEKFN